MAKKAGTKKKNGDKKAKDDSPPFEYEPLTIVDLGFVPPDYVCCKICNAGMGQLNFEWPLVPTTVTLFEIKAAIRQRHLGTITDVLLYQDSAYPGKELLLPDSCTLKDAGIIGICQPDPSQVPVVKITYDFPPVHDIDPLLASGGATYTSRHKIPLKLAVEHEAFRNMSSLPI